MTAFSIVNSQNLPVTLLHKCHFLSNLPEKYKGQANKMFPLSDDHRNLLKTLLENGRETQKEIRARLGFSAKKTSEIISILRRNKVIVGFSAKVNYAELGYAVEGYFIFKLKRKSSFELKEIKDYFGSHISIIEAYELFGRDFDFMVKIMCKTNEELRSICEEIDNIENVENSTTFLHIYNCQNR